MFIYCISGWWFQTFFDFHNIWDNPSHWLSYFSRWLKPPTRYVQCVIPICTVDACCPRRIFSTDLHGRQGRTWKKLVRLGSSPGSPVVVWGSYGSANQTEAPGWPMGSYWSWWFPESKWSGCESHWTIHTRSDLWLCLFKWGATYLEMVHFIFVFMAIEWT